MKWFLKCLKQYADFGGRARRTEYWMFTLFYAILEIVAVVLDRSLGLTVDGLNYGPLNLALWLALLIPSLAVMVRRLHDIGKSGWMALVVLIPFAGIIWMLVMMCTDSQTGDNKWGPNPKELAA